MKAGEIVASGLPWLRLDLAFPHERMLDEARRQAARFVSHRGNGRGWRSLCLHGISPTHTLAATEYGYAGEHEAPHRWTEIAESCPETVAFLKTLPAKRFYRVRFMMLEPGGYIAPHQDAKLSRLGPINVALNQPSGCLFKVERGGVIPFTAGSAFLIDIANRHCLINGSRNARFHIIVHGVFEETNAAWEDLLRRSYHRYANGALAAAPQSARSAAAEPGPTTDPRFVIFALARTGSTTLSRLLQCHASVRCLGEPFNPVLYEGAYARAVTDGESLERTMADIWQEHNAVKHVFHPAGWPFADPALNERLLLDEGHRILLLTRRNRLRRLVSLQMSQQSNVWILDSEESRRKFEGFAFHAIDRAVLKAQFDYERDVLERYQALLAESGKPFLHVHYEDVFGRGRSFEDKLETLQEILAFLGRAPLADPKALRRAKSFFDAGRWTINSAATYRRVPGIDRIEEEFGSDDTGWLFRDA